MGTAALRVEGFKGNVDGDGGFLLANKIKEKNIKKIASGKVSIYFKRADIFFYFLLLFVGIFQLRCGLS